MRPLRSFALGLAGVEGTTFIALGIVAHRLDLWIAWQIGLAPAALGAAVAALVLTLLRERVMAVSSTRLHRYLEAVPNVEGGLLKTRIGAKRALKLVPQRRDGPIEGTNRP